MGCGDRAKRPRVIDVVYETSENKVRAYCMFGYPDDDKGVECF